MDPNQILSTFDRENKTESPLMLQPIMEQIQKSKRAKSYSKNVFVLVSLIAICMNVFGIAMLFSSDKTNHSNFAKQENEWQKVYSSLFINQKPN